MEINFEHKDCIKRTYKQNFTLNYHFREVTAAFELCSGVAICHYILKLGVMLDLNSPWNNELVSIVYRLLKMSIIN